MGSNVSVEIEVVEQIEKIYWRKWWVTSKTTRI